MRDRILDKNIERLEAFVERWKQLMQFLERGFRETSFTPEDEAAFLELKSAIAQEHEALMVLLGNAVERDDKALRLLNSVPSLQSCHELPEGMAKKIEGEWHATFIALEALRGRLRGRQAQLRAVNSLAVALKRLGSHPLLLLLLLVAAAYGVYKFAEQYGPVLYKLVTKLQENIQ